MPEFTTNGLLRYGFGFYDPNHAAALICAIAPFCWGWRGRLRWVGYVAFAALCVALAMTYSRNLWGHSPPASLIIAENRSICVDFELKVRGVSPQMVRSLVAPP